MLNDEAADLLKTIADLQRELAQIRAERDEAMAQQSASADILATMSSSPAQLKSVFETIVDKTTQLCDATFACAGLFEGEALRFAAISGVSADSEFFRSERLHPPDGCPYVVPLARAKKTAQTPDLRAERGYLERDPFYTTTVDIGGARTALRVPLLKGRTVLGHLWAFRQEVRPFSDRQIALLQNFADQAVIAIENVRLFNETREALEQQTATAEILKVISTSPTDVQPVFEAIAQRAANLSEAKFSYVTTFDGEWIHLRATHGPGTEEHHAFYPIRPGSGAVSARVTRDRAPVQIPDVLADAAYAQKEAARMQGFRSAVGVPMLRDGRVVGAIAVARPEPGFVPDKLVRLLQTFADQAVIAIENVRLFNETKEALEQQTATSDILRVISRSPRDVQPVFDTIVGAALRLCSAASANLFTFDGELLHLAAYARHDTAPNPAGDLLGLQKNFPRPPGRDLAGPRAVLTCSVVSIPDVLADNEYVFKELAVAGGFRSNLAVPLVRAAAPIGALVVGRHEPGSFPDKQLALLQTFADQAVIAIENVRLFTELEARTLQLTRSLDELKALGEVGQAVSSTLDLETVLSTIVSRAVQFAGMAGGSIWEYNETREEFYVRATDRLPDELVEVHRATAIRKGEGALGRLAMTGEPVEICDIAVEPGYPVDLREILIRSGYRSVLAVPLLREDHLLGALAVSRTAPGKFAPEVIALLKAFGTQSALAIQNARLYREIEVKSRELEAASRHKSEFLANMSHELRTPLNAIIGFSEVLSERMFGEINEKQAEYIGDILQSGQHLLSLINDILDLSKIEAGRMDLELSNFDLANMINGTITLVRERAVRRGIALGRAIDQHLAPVRADERKLKQVLLNLLSNALKFTPEGGRIDVRASVNDGVAEISVTDTGVGISAEDQEVVFEEFRQVGTASKKVEGTGLGLAISRKFIELHGGKIWVKSAVGSGSTFAFTLPIR